MNKENCTEREKLMYSLFTILLMKQITVHGMFFITLQLWPDVFGIVILDFTESS